MCGQFFTIKMTQICLGGYLKMIYLIGKKLRASCFPIFAYAWNSFPVPCSSLTHLFKKFDFNFRVHLVFQTTLAGKPKCSSPV